MPEFSLLKQHRKLVMIPLQFTGRRRDRGCATNFLESKNYYGVKTTPTTTTTAINDVASHKKPTGSCDVKIDSEDTLQRTILRTVATAEATIRETGNDDCQVTLLLHPLVLQIICLPTHPPSVCRYNELSLRHRFA